MSHASSEFIPAHIAILTVSDSRGAAGDTSGQYLQEAAQEAVAQAVGLFRIEQPGQGGGVAQFVALHLEHLERIEPAQALLQLLEIGVGAQALQLLLQVGLLHGNPCWGHSAPARKRHRRTMASVSR